MGRVPLQPPLDPAADRRRRRREALYVLLQCIGWLGFLAMNIFFGRYFMAGQRNVDLLELVAANVQVIGIGWLLTHFARGRMKRWGWHQLGWLPLVPRACGMAAALSVLWTAIGYGYQFGLMDHTIPEPYSPVVILAVSLVNGFILMLGWLALYFSYQVFDRYNRSEIERLRLETSVKEAELRALKAQVNPHFMFNALNSVRALIDEDPNRARLAVTQLANLLRYSLQAGNWETVRFEEELKVVKDYLALEQVRHDERLRVRIHVDAAAASWPVPPMLLQTLVENAVKYGVSERAEGGEVGIEARCRDESLELEVTNPGSLATDRETGGRTASTQLGLRNAAERLRLLFGVDATLALTERPSGCVVARVTIPWATRAPLPSDLPQPASV